VLARLAVAALAVSLVLPAPASGQAPWRAADRVAAALFDAQAALLLDEPAGRIAPLSGVLERRLARSAPAALRTARSGLAAARRAVRVRAEGELAAARGTVVAALRRGAYAVTLDAVRRGDVATARSWLLIRDFREATRFGPESTPPRHSTPSPRARSSRKPRSCRSRRTCSTPTRRG